MVTEINSKNQLNKRKFKRNEMLAEYFFGLSKLIVSGVGIGALSPLFTGETMEVVNLACIGFALITAVALGMIVNNILKVELKKK